jgi:hypothetical protein
MVCHPHDHTSKHKCAHDHKCAHEYTGTLGDRVGSGQSSRYRF